MAFSDTQNYLNVKNNPNDPWLDANDQASRSDSRRHAIFSDPAYSIRAAIKLLRVYFFTYKKRTTRGVIFRWAPPTDTIGSLPGTKPNPSEKYARFVADKVGVSPTTPLEIFQSDGAIGNIEQLRLLIAAMTTFEQGHDIKLKNSHFYAGLELVQPGIKAGGNDTPLSSPESDASVSITEEAKNQAISTSVGKWEKKAKNKKADILCIQELLLHASHILENPKIDPGVIDGKISKTKGRSQTVKAIVAFQKRYMPSPDGVVDAGGRSWRELASVVQTGDYTKQHLTGDTKYFPLKRIPKKSWTSGPGAFASPIKVGNTINPGCSLYCSIDTAVHAISEGFVTRQIYYFFANTYAIEIDHGDFTIRYGGLANKQLVEEGDYIEAGEVIAHVGDMKNVTASQLHIELYKKTRSGSLNVGKKDSAKTKDGLSFYRRKDLTDPTKLLNKLKENLIPRTTKRPKIKQKTNGAVTTGFSVVIDRLSVQKASGSYRKRTIGYYICYWDGEMIEGLEGYIAEPRGPGSNYTNPGDYQDLRIEEGIYPLRIQGWKGSKYSTYFGKNENIPGILVGQTNQRTAVLIHPGKNFLSSVGCLNPTHELSNGSTLIKWGQSRKATINIIDAIKDHLGSKFPKSGTIPNCHLIIRGEP